MHPLYHIQRRIPPIIRGSSDWKRENNNKERFISRGQPVQTVFNDCPELILDAPGLIDDFYSSLIDWKVIDSTESRISVALSSSIYLYTPETRNLCQLGGASNQHPQVTCVKFLSTTSPILLSSGSQNGIIQIWDTAHVHVISEWKSDLPQRVMAISSITDHVFAAGQESGEILIFDLRSNRMAGRFSSNLHTQEICGIAPRKNILATGSNDNTVGIWDLRQSTSSIHSRYSVRPLFKIRHHTSAVKALEWVDDNTLFSGGGSSDGRISLWDVPNTGALLYEENTGAQITHMIPILGDHLKANLMALSHGYATERSISEYTAFSSITVWEYVPVSREIKQIQRIPSAHSGRVLHLASIPHKLLSCGADETLRFWSF